MAYEVELKFRLPDATKVRRALAELGAVTVGRRTEVDTYLRHPARSFAETDEALRVRQLDSQLLVTYKGPRIDNTTKTRIEIELAFAPGKHTAAEVLEFWQRLSFDPVREVTKQRELLDVRWLDRTVHVSVDRVAGLGEFMELELSAESAEVEQCRQILINLAQRLDLRQSERRSYLELLLQKEGATADTAKKPEDWSE